MSELARGWVEATLGEIAQFVMGQAPLGSASNFEGVGTPFVKAGEFGELRPIIREWTTQPLKYASREDILICVVGATAGKINLGEDCAIGRSVAAIRPVESASQYFLYNFLKTTVLKLRKGSVGSAQAVISKDNLSDLALPLPPLAEQKRIVAKLDALNAKSARARTELARIETLVSRYKQAVLDLLCDVSHSTVSLRDLVDQSRGIPYGIVQTGNPVMDGVPTVRCGDIKNYTIRKTELKLVDGQIAHQYGRTELIGGEVLIAIRGSIGETCVVGKDMVGCNISREVAMIPLLPGTSPQFVMYFLKSNKAREFIGANTKGSAQQGINLGDLRNLPIPALRLEEQHEIVRRIESAFAKIDRLAIEAKRALELVARLDEAILAKAFRGELVPQDENDEPAENLLARIRAEREMAPRTKRGRGAKA